MLRRIERWINDPSVSTIVRAVEIVVLAITVVGIVSGAVVGTRALLADDHPGHTATAAEVASDDLGCADDHLSYTIEGSVGVANVTAGDTLYESSIYVSNGDTIKFQMYFRNRESEGSVENLRARLVTSGNPFDALVELQACGSNTRLLRDSVTVSADEPFQIRFDDGSVKIRAFDADGNRYDRGGSDEFFRHRGESLGRLTSAVPGDALTVTATATVVRTDKAE
jgi:hypothetical protein